MKIRRQHIGFLLLLPTLILMGLFTLFPLLDALRISLTDANLLRERVKFLGFANYVDTLRDPVFWLSFLHSLLLTGSAVLLELTLGILLALVLKQALPGMQGFRSMIMATWVIPIASTVVMFKFMVQPDYGYVNILMRAVGLGRFNTYWFGSLPLAMPAMVLLNMWRNVPFFGVALLAAMHAIPASLFEAAQMDGAGVVRRFRHIILPGIRSMIIVMVTIHVINTFNNFEFVYLSTGGGPVNSTNILPVYAYRLGWQNYDMGRAASVGTVMLAILALYFLVSTIYTERKSGRASG